MLSIMERGKIKQVENKKITYMVALAEEDFLLLTGDQIRYNQYLEQAIFCLCGMDFGVQSTNRHQMRINEK